MKIKKGLWNICSSLLGDFPRYSTILPTPIPPPPCLPPTPVVCCSPSYPPPPPSPSHFLAKSKGVFANDGPQDAHKFTHPTSKVVAYENAPRFLPTSLLERRTKIHICTDKVHVREEVSLVNAKLKQEQLVGSVSEVRS